jgi:hypothetical protein
MQLRNSREQREYEERFVLEHRARVSRLVQEQRERAVRVAQEEKERLALWDAQKPEMIEKEKQLKKEEIELRIRENAPRMARIAEREAQTRAVVESLQAKNKRSG